MSRKVSINGVDYEVFKFKYISDKIDNEDYFIFLEDSEIEEKYCQIGEIYIVVPTYIEMQDIYQSSCIKDPRTKKYIVDEEVYKDNKVYLLCNKIVESDGTVNLMNIELLKNICYSFADWIERKVESVINNHYRGTGLSEEVEEFLNYSCYKYYSALEKQKKGVKDIVVPPPPGIIVLMNVCEIFNCSPDVARRISKKDIESMFIAKKQKNLCENDPGAIGFNMRHGQ